MKVWHAVLVVLLIMLVAYLSLGSQIERAFKDIEESISKGVLNLEGDLKSDLESGHEATPESFGNYAGYAYRFPYLHYPWYRRLGYYGRVYGLPFFLAGPVGRGRYYFNYPHSLI